MIFITAYILGYFAYIKMFLSSLSTVKDKEIQMLAAYSPHHNDEIPSYYLLNCENADVFKLYGNNKRDFMYLHQILKS